MQKYLVMHKFRSFGKMLLRGQIVEETALRSPRLRVSEGKVIPIKDIVDNSKQEEAVSSKQEPEGGVEEDKNALTPPKGPETDNIKPLFKIRN